MCLSVYVFTLPPVNNQHTYTPKHLNTLSAVDGNLVRLEMMCRVY